jgi:hypothetical protein
MKIIILTLFATLLVASNPKVYTPLGDVIYDNVSGIESLKNIEEYVTFKEEIVKYARDVKKTKQDGFEIERGNKKIDNKAYLEKLRLLSKTNDYFIRSAKNSFKSSIENENSKLFTQIVNSGLVDTQKYKSEIVTYYLFHMQEIDPSGVIQDILDNDEALKQKKMNQKKIYKSKKQLEQEKIQRIRENDKREQAEIEKKLQEKVYREKKKIIENQRKELSN